MNIPRAFLDEVRRIEAEEKELYADCGGRYESDWSLAESRRSSGVVFPPFGFAAFPDFMDGDSGLNDEVGFYWPIGREDQEPLIAKTARERGGFIPIASSRERFQQIRQWSEAIYEREKKLSREQRSVFYSPALLAERLAIDPDSPYLQTAVADVAMADGDLDRAEALYQSALDRIPEYTAARIALAMLLRRSRRPVEALGHILKALRSPIPMFGTYCYTDDALLTDRVNRDEYRLKFLDWIRRYNPKAAGEHADDPLFQARDRLTFAREQKTNDDYRIYDEAIDAYITGGQPIEAVGLAMVCNGLMASETVAFRERYDETELTQRARLMKTFQAAGLTGRVEWLASLPEPED